MNTQGPGAPRDEAEIVAWLMERLEARLGPGEEIDLETPFARFGLSSVDAVELSGELEEWLHCKLSPTLVWEHPTIAALARHLFTLRSRPVPA